VPDSGDDRLPPHMSVIGKLIANLAVVVLIAVGGGLGSAWYMIEAGSRLSTRTFGPWTTWHAAGRTDADPYTRARIVRDGLLPLASTLELTYRAKTDSSGAQLQSGCEYAVTVDALDGAWWNLAAFDRKGALSPNAADRYAFTSDTAMREPDGRAVIVVARDARPGNWLPVGGGRITLVLTVQDATMAAAVYEGRAAKALPTIQKIACR
jgi:hypothetical protein